MDPISKALQRNEQIRELTRRCGENHSVYATGLPESARIFLTRLLTEERRVFLLLPDTGEAERFSDLFGALCEPEQLLLFPAREPVLYHYENLSREAERRRLRALERLMAGDYRICLLPVDALCLPLPEPEDFRAHRQLLKKGAELDADEFLRRLCRDGYQNADLIECPGQFSRRGGILEFFSPGEDAPVRIELFGDEIDRMTHFDPATQRSTEDLEEAAVLPVRELLPGEKELGRIRAFLEKGLAGQEDGDFTRQELALLDEGRFTALDRFLPLILPHAATALSYDEEAAVVCYDLPKLREAADAYRFRFANDCAVLTERGALLPKGEAILDAAALNRLLRERAVWLFEDFLRQEQGIRFSLVQGYRMSSLSAPGADEALCDEIAFYRERGKVIVFAGSPARASYLPSLLTERGIPFARTLKEERDDAVTLLSSGFPGGFYDPEGGLAVLGSARLSGKKKRRTRHAPGARISSFSDISVGDYIVHENYGIGIYEGVEKVVSQGVASDFIKLRYAGSDTLFIPAGQFDQISKYLPVNDEAKVKLSRLGTADWSKTKARVKKQVQDLADGLIRLYSARQALPGHAFLPDDEMQRQFEAAFPYEETDDQRIATDEIKADMERPVPMDRLLCGDVGFGKTEVALRAAFKCIENGKQAAILTPTTLLAWQHYNTIRARFEGFPVTVELLSRFRTPQQQEKILRRLRRGEIDLLVGTHRLIQKDVVFKDLGLLIVDEEQRFGVSHKEALKEMTREVDVLTLSATPIPRTLNMALSGIRDMSTLDTPPSDRHPVATYVCEYSDDLIADAIRRELARGGQVYYLHNRVESIYKVADRLARLFPQAEVDVAHGKMSKEELSEVWERMTEGETSILVCTTIIETGVDVPDANTLIIEDADRLGLAQLHQIRGRVGRSYRKAYAYFTYRAGRVLTEDGRKRLDAIREYTEFGSGFRIAMRDLQIRGAGDLLGAAQSGHMDSVGYDLYMQLLNEAISEKRGEAPAPRPRDCLVDLKVSAYLPQSYVESEAARVDLYKKIAAVETEEDCSDLLDEMIERFGDPPREVLALVDLSLIRTRCAKAGIREISFQNNQIRLKFEKPDMEKIAALISRFPGKMFFSAGNEPYIAAVSSRPVLEAASEIAANLE